MGITLPIYWGSEAFAPWKLGLQGMELRLAAFFSSELCVRASSEPVIPMRQLLQCTSGDQVDKHYGCLSQFHVRLAASLSPRLDFQLLQAPSVVFHPSWLVHALILGRSREWQYQQIKFKGRCKRAFDTRRSKDTLSTPDTSDHDDRAFVPSYLR